jgi:NodT family efflux transporter outer membrane factor (OMF) lipoprotein
MRSAHPVSKVIQIWRPAAILLGLSSCAVGPNYHPPAAPSTGSIAPAASLKPTKAGNAAQNFTVGADIQGDWWTLFHSPALNSLVTAAFTHNPTLVQAQNALLQQEEVVRADAGGLLPKVSASFQAEREQIAAGQLATFGANATAAKIPPFSLFNASVGVSYTLDVFGGTRRQIESAQAQADYQRDVLEATYLSLSSNVITAAVQVASLQAQIDATNMIIADEQNALDIMQRRAELGGVPVADVISQESTLASERATLPPLQSQLALEQNQLAALTGALPTAFTRQVLPLEDLHLPRDLPVSLPSYLVQQRPDIREAADQLHEATANVGVATANMLPQITLSGSYGEEALKVSQLFTPQAALWSLVAGITQPIFQGGQLRAQRKEMVYALRAAGAAYQNTVITAFQNVDDALQALQYDALALTAYQAAEDAARRSLVVTRAQYQLGGQPFTAVLTAETTYQTAVINRVKAQASRLSDTAALFVALGGGWWNRNDVTPEAVSCCGLIP